jgi:DNA-binding GntR family transcriptional regulator
VRERANARAPLREQAYARIRRELVTSGPLAFGGRLVEQQLAEELSMSRTPVRDALSRLAGDGLIESVPGGGYVARRAQLRDVREEYELRLLLEPEAAALACGRPVADCNVADESEFHLAVAAATDNEVLARTIGAVISRSTVHPLERATSAAERRLLEQGHVEILEAVVRGDAVAAASAMAEHLALLRDLTVEAVRAEESPDA